MPLVLQQCGFGNLMRQNNLIKELTVSFFCCRLLINNKMYVASIFKEGI